MIFLVGLLIEGLYGIKVIIFKLIVKSNVLMFICVVVKVVLELVCLVLMIIILYDFV